MVLVETPLVDFGWSAAPFRLIGVDGVWHKLDDLKGERGTVIAFICNHCPYVKAIISRLVKAAQDMKSFQVSTIAICSNDFLTYPDDSYDKMRDFSTENSFCFPYLHDASQEVARAYDAVCTPDFFGFDSELHLKYRGRLDSGRLEQPARDAPCELTEAMRLIAEGMSPPEQQHPSMGCSIKWLL